MKFLSLMIAAILICGCSPTTQKLKIDNKPAIDYPTPPITQYDNGLDGQLSTLAHQVALQFSGNSIIGVGHKGFYDLKGRSRRFEKYLDIEFVNHLIRTEKFMVFGPEDLEKIQSDGNNGKNGETLKTGKTYGRISNIGRIDAYIIGSTVDMPKSIKVSVKLISSKTGLIFGMASVLIHKDNKIASLFKKYGITQFDGVFNSNYRTGQIIKASDNQYVELIPEAYILYIKQVNFEYNLYTDSDSCAEIFINDEYRVMKENDMIALTYDNEQYVLALHNIIDHMATFTFANLATGITSSPKVLSSVHNNISKEKEQDINLSVDHNSKDDATKLSDENKPGDSTTHKSNNELKTNKTDKYRNDSQENKSEIAQLSKDVN